MDMMTRAFFRSQGYVAMPQVIDQPELERLYGQCLDVPTIRSMSATEHRAEQVHRYVSVPAILEKSPRLRAALQDLVGPNLYLIVNRHNHLGISRAGDYRSARMHRDALGWLRSYVTVLIPLDGFESPLAQLRLVPGSHLWPPEGTRNGGGFWLDDGPYETVEAQAVATRLSVGDVLCIDPLLFHAAGHGLPQAPRAMLSLAIHGGDELATTVPATEILLTAARLPYRGQSWVLEK